MNDTEMSQWATHLPTLLACATATEGPIVECGVGVWSTPILHALCAPTRRPLLSLDSDGWWIERFRSFASPSHQVQVIEDWARLPEGHWSLALVDHGVAPRGPVVAALRGRADLIVVHDSEADYCGYTDALKSFDWCWTHTFSPAWTTVAGMGTPPRWIGEALTPGVWGVPRPYR